MDQNNEKSDMAKAWVFFDKGRKLAEKNNFDYAIEMYIEGLRHSPEAIFDGHIRLHQLALQRKEKGGKKPSMMEKVKLLRPRRQNPLEQMLGTEMLFAKDPSSISLAEAFLKAAISGGYKQTAKWVADMLFQMNSAARKPSFNTFILLKDCYSRIEEYDRALLALQCAVKIKPHDGELSDEYKRLSAEVTVARGKYDQEGDFRKSIKDREVQEKLQAQSSVVKTQDYRIQAIEDAKKALEADPDTPKNIFNLAKVLEEMDQDKYEKVAIEILENAFRKKSDFSFKERAGQIRIKQVTRKLREAAAALEAKPEDAKAKAALQQMRVKLNEVKREHYRLCVENYPTNMQAKYEYASSLLENKQYDDAIPLFQEAQRDPRHKIASINKIGLCFFMKQWYTDAIDIFQQAIKSYEAEDDDTAKELRYNLGRSFEADGQEDNALEIYRKIAQLDFGYKDIRKRIDELRKKQSES